MPSELSGTSLEFAFTCPLSAGMHARPASQLAEAVKDFHSDLVLKNLRNGREANAKSVLSIIASDIRQGDRCLLHASGADEQLALKTIRTFIEEGLPKCDTPLAENGPPVRNGVPRGLSASGVRCLAGTPVSRGIARGKVVVLNSLSVSGPMAEEPVSDPAQELSKLKLAIAIVRDRIRQKITRSGSSHESAILEAGLAMASDVSLVERLTDEVSRGKSAGVAMAESGEYFAQVLRQSGSEYVSARAQDFQEISFQILEELYGSDFQRATLLLSEPSIVVAETLAPQQLLNFDRALLKGLVLEHAGVTSHAMILARSFGIPTLVAVKNARALLSPRQEVLVDANRGIVIPTINDVVERFYNRELKILSRRRRTAIENYLCPPKTKDGKQLEIAANASSPEEARFAFENTADGIGLFRTEMMFLERPAPPSEDEQFTAYSRAVQLAGERPLIIRTLDAGGDKGIEYLNLPREDNPFLGRRGVRIYQAHPDLLQVQLRAILRAASEGNVRVIVPMISTVQQVLDFKVHLETAAQDLDARNIPFRRNIPLGIMLEVPAAAFILDELCAEIDFVSIGTNDLAQYFLAADRNNSAIAALSNPAHPGFIRFLQRTVQEIHRLRKQVSICGEMATSPRYLPMLLGLGFDQISVSASSVRELKDLVMRLSADECSELVDQLVKSVGISDVEALLDSAQKRESLALLSDELIQLESDSKTKEEAIQELVDMFYVANRTEQREALEAAVWERETVYSTGVGFGFATPHCKTSAVVASSIAVLRLRQPIHWGSLDNEPVRVVILIVMRDPQEGAGDHMQVFSELARKMMDEGFRARLLAINNPKEMMQYLGGQLDLT